MVGAQCFKPVGCLHPVAGAVGGKCQIPLGDFVQQGGWQIRGQTQGLKNRHRTVLAFDTHPVYLAAGPARQQIARFFTNQHVHAIDLGQALQAGAQVDRVAHDRVGAADFGAHVTHPHGPGVEAHADAELRPALAQEVLVQPLRGALHVQGGAHRVLGMVCVGHGCAPKGHDRVADVFVQRALVAVAYHFAHGGEVGVDQFRQRLGAQMLGYGREITHIGEQHSEFALHGRHGESLRVLRHDLHQLGRHVVGKQLRDLPLASRFNKEAIGHLKHKHHEQTGQGRGQRQHELLAHQKAEVERKRCSQREHKHHDGVGRLEPGAAQDHEQAQNQHAKHFHALRVGRGVHHAPVKHAGNQVGVHFHARKTHAHGRGHQIGQAGGGRTDQHDAVLQLRGRNPPLQDVHCGYVVKTVGCTPVRNQRVQRCVHGHLDPCDVDFFYSSRGLAVV